MDAVDTAAMTATTASGRVYVLVGNPDPDYALHVPTTFDQPRGEVFELVELRGRRSMTSGHGIAAAQRKLDLGQTSLDTELFYRWYDMLLEQPELEPPLSAWLAMPRCARQLLPPPASSISDARQGRQKGLRLEGSSQGRSMPTLLTQATVRRMLCGTIIGVADPRCVPMIAARVRGALAGRVVGRTMRQALRWRPPVSFQAYARLP